MSSANRSKSRPRLSVAMDVDPRGAEEMPAEPAKAGNNPPAAQEAGPTASQVNTPSHKRPSTKSKQQPVKSAAAVQVPTDDPTIQEINGRIYVVVGDDLMPEGARVQMTIALTAIERHKWLQYAKQHDLTLIEVLRRAMSQLLD